MFCPSATFSRFKWEGGYWNPILLCLLVGGPSGLAVLFFTGFPLIGGVTVNFVTLAGLFLGLLLGLGAMVVSLFLFSGSVLGTLYALGGGSPSYQGIFRAIAYTSVLIELLNTILGFSICAIFPKPLWDHLQSAVLILLMIWQGYCIVAGLCKTTSVPLWKPVTAVVLAMLLAYGSVEMTSINNPIGQKIWNGILHAIRYF